MKTMLPFLFLFLPSLAVAQAIDSAAIKQVDSLILVSRALTDGQDFAGAHAANDAAEQIAQQKCGKESLSWGNTCFNHGRILYFEGFYPAAEPWYIESKAIRERLLGKNHPDYAKSLNNLAVVYDEMSQYEMAEPLYLEAIAIREKLLGKENASYANALSNLAGLYMDTGEYEKSELLNLEAKDIRERVLGKASPDYASSLNNLANLYFKMGNYEMAEPLHLESKAIRKAALDTENIDFILGLDNLGVLYQFMGKYEAAGKQYDEALGMLEKSFDDGHPVHIQLLSHLAGLYHLTGNYDKSESLFLQTQAIGERVLGKENGDYAMYLLNLVELYQEMGLYEKAKPICIESNQIIEKRFGKLHENYVAGLDNLAVLYWGTGDYALAKPLFLEASKIRHQLLLQASHYLSERELSAFAQLFNQRLSRIFSFASTQPGMAGACYDDILFHKGFLLNAVQQVSKLAATDTAATEKLNLLKSYHRLLAAQYAKPIEERSDISDLEAKANATEKALSRTVAGLGQALRQITWQEVQVSLKTGEAAIEFVHFQYLNPRLTDSTMYTALVLLPGEKEPHLVPLFEEKQLAKLLGRKGERKADLVNGIYASMGAKLYELIWQPLEKWLGGVNTIYFSPTGLLHKLNLSAITIAGEKSGVLADHYGMVELGSTRQLAVEDGRQTANGERWVADGSFSEAVLFGGINYEWDSTAIVAANGDLQTGESADEGLLGVCSRGLESASLDSTSLRGGPWKQLPWTEVEVISLENMLAENGIKAKLLQGYKATEEALKSISGQSPRILHVATHGFFFADPKTEEAGRLTMDGSKSVFKISKNPMMRSGLVLAGGNHAWQQGRPGKLGMEDGILTAYEISHLDLHNTELVVLSACETGLGDIQGNEGVYGLQRAFKIAGAKYLIMSLWQVPDYQTQQLMTSFYNLWLDEKMSIPDAFRSAQKAMREKYNDPFLWAGFVLVECLEL